MSLRYSTRLTGNPSYENRIPDQKAVIIAGQGTLGLEIPDQVPDADTVVVLTGGGGLIGGVSKAIAERAPSVRVVGVQAEDAATVPQSLQKGAPQTIDSARSRRSRTESLRAASRNSRTTLLTSMSTK